MVKKTVHRRKSQSVHSSKRATTTSIGSDDDARWTCAFDADSSLALVRSGINGHKLRVIDVHTGAQRSEHAGEGGAKIHSVAWGTQGAQGAQGAAQAVVAMGLQSGDVQLYSPARGAVVRTLAGAHTGAVVALAFAEGRLLSLDGDGLVVQWDVASGQALAQMRTGLAGARALLASADGQRVAVASHRIEMWDVARQSRLHAWPGHASPVHTLLWAADEAALVSAAEGDRHVHVWDASPDAAARPRAVLATDSDVMHVDVSPRGSVLAVGADGVLHAWHQVAVAQRSANGPRRGDIGYTADGRVRFASTADASRTLPVLLARFSRVAGDEGHVLVVRGSALKPLFEPLSLAGADGQFAPELVLSREPQDNLLLSAGQTAAEKQVAAQLHAYSEQGATVTDPLAEGVRASRAAADDAAGAALPSLADRIKQLSVAGSDQSGAPALAAGLKLTAGTLVRVLVQSLHTSDHEMLETVLSNNARANVVRDTVLGLPTAYVLLFLQQLFERFHATPARAAQLLPWIRSTLALHSAYLTSIPGLIPQLSGFYQAIESRLHTHQRLLRLSGRLELANTQIRARSQLEKAHDRQLHDSHKNAPMQPLNTYREEDDDESDGPTRLSTEPPTPVWQAAQSTDDEASSDDDAQASDDEQWNEGSAASSDEEMAAEGSGSSSDDGSDDDSNEDSGSDSASDLDELE